MAVTPLPRALLGGKPVSWLDFRTIRPRGKKDEDKKYGSRGDSPAMGYRIEFADPVRGPIALGYGAHFGLGAFYPE